MIDRDELAKEIYKDLVTISNVDDHWKQIAEDAFNIADAFIEKMNQEQPEDRPLVECPFKRGDKIIRTDESYTSIGEVTSVTERVGFTVYVMWASGVAGSYSIHELKRIDQPEPETRSQYVEYCETCLHNCGTRNGGCYLRCGLLQPTGYQAKEPSND